MVYKFYMSVDIFPKWVDYISQCLHLFIFCQVELLMIILTFLQGAVRIKSGKRYKVLDTY